MAFVARTYEVILADMISYVQANTVLSDFTVGSVIRTILEAAASEDDEQYFQMVQLLDAFSIITATGQDLDDRLADYNIVRKNAFSATGRVVFSDRNIITNQASFDTPIGGTTVSCFSIASFPTAFPYVIRVGERTSRVQDLTAISGNVLTGTFTLSTPLIYDVLVGDRVSYVDSSAGAKSIPLGTNVQVPPSVGNAARIFSTQEAASILPGNYFSNEVLVKANTPGASGNVGAGRISQFLSSEPFPGALVTNLAAAGGGSSRETDSEFTRRGLQKLQSLSRGTPLAVRSAALNVIDPITKQRVTSANLIEDFVNNEVNLYIDDGTGLTPDIQNLPQDSLLSGATATSTNITLSSAADFPSSGYVLIEVDSSNNPIELLSYSSKFNNTISLDSPLAYNHDVGAIVNFVDVVTLAAEQGQRRFKLRNFPVVRFSDRVFLNNGLGWNRIVSGTDYILNRGTGEIQIINSTGVALGAMIASNYDYYTNLIANVQKVLEGDRNNPNEFPGVKASGVFLNVEAPILRRIVVRASITVEQGYNEADLAPRVSSAISDYIRTLGIGEDVIRSKLVDIAHNITGIRDITIQSPTGNVVILENELPVPFDSSGNSIIQVF